MSSDLMLMLWDSFVETVIMVGLSGFIGSVFGIPLGILLHVTDNGGVHPMPIFNKVLGWIINAVRSTPFIILLVAIIPLTRVIAGTSIGTAAAVVPLTIAVAPFIARLVETSLREVDKGLIEAAQAMGATNLQIVMKVLLPESLPSLLNGALVSATTILGYSAMAGFIGGGGLGDIAIRYGYNRYEMDTMFITVVLLVILVQIIQSVGSRIAKRSDKRIND